MGTGKHLPVGIRAGAEQCGGKRLQSLPDGSGRPGPWQEAHALAMAGAAGVREPVLGCWVHDMAPRDEPTQLGSSGKRPVSLPEHPTQACLSPRTLSRIGSGGQPGGEV